VFKVHAEAVFRGIPAVGRDVRRLRWADAPLPKISGTETRGPIRLHKALAWIHGPGMILTPILGALAYGQKNKGEKDHGICICTRTCSHLDGCSVRGCHSVCIAQILKDPMNANILIALLLLALPRIATAADSTWVLQQFTISYHVSHPLHQVDGVSHADRGKGIRHEGQCDFVIAVTVKSFDSGDGNRDIHMLQVTRGAQFPMVTVRPRSPEAISASSDIRADLEIQLAGQTVQYKQVTFHRWSRARRADSQEQYQRPSPISR
jgi:hypothetical protein